MYNMYMIMIKFATKTVKFTISLSLVGATCVSEGNDIADIFHPIST